MKQFTKLFASLALLSFFTAGQSPTTACGGRAQISMSKNRVLPDYLFSIGIYSRSAKMFL